MISVADHRWLNAPPTVAAAPVIPVCGNCRHFENDAINPAAGLGNCLAGHGSTYPDQRKHCADYHAIK
jgi:hypothetical protein